MLVIVAIFCILLAVLYFYGTKHQDYWAKRGVKHEKPLPFFGNARRQLMQQISAADLYTEYYCRYPNERFVGFYDGLKPMLIIRDPELVRRVLISDFDYFYSRGIQPSREVHEPMAKNIFGIDGDLWKLLRQKLTPAFTSGKLKSMFPLIVEKTEKLNVLLEDAANTGAELDMRDLMAKYTTDFIGAVGFGIDSESMKMEDSQFRVLGKRIFTITKWDAIRILFKTVFPETFKKVHVFPAMVEETVMQLLRTILKQRDYKPSGRNDFVDQLLELQQKGKIITESVEHKNPDGTPVLVELELNESLMAAQIFVFFAAGFETSSASSSFTLHQLAFHEDAQKKCQEEIDEVLSRYENKLCYDAVAEMKYLDMCFKEAMRLFPSVGFLKRRCDFPYHVPFTNFTIDKDVEVVISVNGLHRDPKYFEDPDRFIPERFESGKIPKYTYLPFGEGPRACIGERLGRMQSLAGLAAVLRGYTVSPASTS